MEIRIPPRLNQAEQFCLDSFKQGPHFVRIYIEEIKICLLPDYRQLYRLGLIDKRRQIFWGYCYVISEKGIEFLERPRIRVRTVTNKYGGIWVIYNINKGKITQSQVKSYIRVSANKYVKSIS